jgi:hypothetical protein
LALDQNGMLILLSFNKQLVKKFTVYLALDIHIADTYGNQYDMNPTCISSIHYDSALDIPPKVML